MAENTLITSLDIQAKYQKLYKFLMQYLWQFNVVEDLANLEIACYQRFPDKDEMLKYLQKLNNGIKGTYNELSEEDEPEFEAAYNELYDAIDSYDPEITGVDIFVVAPPVELSDNITALKVKKEKFKIGDIEKRNASEVEDAEAEPKNRIVNPFEDEEE